MTNFLNILLPAIVLLLLGFAGLALNLLVRKKGSFPDFHIHSNKYLQENDIHCIHKEDSMEQFRAREKEKFRNLKYLGTNRRTNQN